jgi:hypothetical protein
MLGRSSIRFLNSTLQSFLHVHFLFGCLSLGFDCELLVIDNFALSQSWN